MTDQGKGAVPGPAVPAPGAPGPEAAGPGVPGPAVPLPSAPLNIEAALDHLNELDLPEQIEQLEAIHAELGRRLSRARV
ncbi:hypothetical protein [Actinotignum schaalii]|uniref:hypothetical protein n=1 Tax=Actinotignum schaalii TaxID=59505 RepID=UPI00040B6A9E|nr:hypothetical protein [Actinotignum schaalii]AIE82195.1 hypothetical protein FB03_01705 [Actinotignum schaalii]WQN45895.1 hypothetical protein U4A90_04220 [Actinotignum schaalii]